MADSMFLFEDKLRVKPIEASPQTANLIFRYMAFLFDGFLILMLLFFVEVFLSAYIVQTENPLNVPAFLVRHVAYWLIPAQIIIFIYYAYFYMTYGASPGKMVFGLRVISTIDNQNPTLTQIFIRETLGKFFSYVSFGLGFALAFVRRDGRAFHDLLSSCQVVPAAQKIQPK